MALEKIGGTKRLIIALVLMGFLLYVAQSTRPVPNTVLDEKGKPTGNVMVTAATQKVIVHSFTSTHLIICCGLILLLVMSDVNATKRITARQAQEIAKKELEYHRDILKEAKFQGAIAVGNARLRLIIGEEQTTPTRWVVGATITENDAPTFYKIEMDLEGFITSIMEAEKEFDQLDICWKCGGKDYDLKSGNLSLKDFARARRELGVR